MLKRWIAILCVVGAVLVMVAVGAMLAWPKGPVPAGAQTPCPEGDGWVDLLDATHAAGWKNVTDTKDIFEIKDGVLHVYGRSWWPLRYVGYEPETFGDFDLHVEFKVARGANSGVFLRAQAANPVHRGFEVQVLEDFGHAPTKHSCGSIYDVVTPMFNMSLPAGEWNSYDISVAGSSVSVTMNGWLVVQTDMSKMALPYGKFKMAYAEMPRDGLLLFQDHGGEVWYRNVVIRKRQSS